MDKDHYNGTMQKLRQRFLFNLREWLPLAVDLQGELQKGSVSSISIERIQTHLHKCVGGAETFGFPDLTQYAQIVEDKLFQLEAGRELNDSFGVEVLKALKDFISRAEDHIENNIRNEESGYPLFKSAVAPSSDDYDYHIIIVDDDVLIRDAISDGLEGKKIKISFAEDGLRFLKKMETERLPKVDLVILDVNMPRVDGFEALKTIKATPSMQSVPVFMLTRRDSEEDIELAQSYGVTQYITKPFDIRQFLSTVEAALVTAESGKDG